MDKKEKNQLDLEKRKKMFVILGSVVSGLAFIYFIYWFFIGSNHIKTDNAYVAVEIAQVTPFIDGTVKAIHAIDTQVVKAGDTLVVIDDIDAKLALHRAEADFSRAQTDLERTKLDMERRKSLTASGSVSAEEMSNAKNAFKVAEASFNAAKAFKEQAEINLKRTKICSPIDGVVACRKVQLGQKITAGSQLLSIVPLQEVHVDANFKEVELAKVKIGQPVQLTSDLYGPSVKYKGHVAGVSGGTGAAFSLIPAQNATGNWIKVVQRLPVRITLDKDQLIKHPLQVGLSMYVDINVAG